VNLIKEAPMGGAICDYFGIVQPPKDGHLWDLAWDERQPCIGNHPTWSQFVRDLRQGMGLAPFGQPDQGWNKHGVYNTGPTRACWMSRGKNRWTDEALVEKWVRSTCHGKQPVEFTNVKFDNTQDISLSDQAAVFEKCDVLLGVHGAGMMNSMFMEPKSAVIEIEETGHRGASYYRNVAQFSGHIYFQRITCVAEGPQDPDMRQFDHNGNRAPGAPACIGTESGGTITLDEAAFREVLYAAVASTAEKGGRARNERVGPCQSMGVSVGTIGRSSNIGREFAMNKVEVEETKAYGEMSPSREDVVVEEPQPQTPANVKKQKEAEETKGHGEMSASREDVVEEEPQPQTPANVKKEKEAEETKGHGEVLAPTSSTPNITLARKVFKGYLDEILHG